MKVNVIGWLHNKMFIHEHVIPEKLNLGYVKIFVRKRQLGTFCTWFCIVTFHKVFYIKFSIEKIRSTFYNFQLIERSISWNTHKEGST